MSTRTGAGRRWIQCLATEVEALLFSVRGPTFFKGVYRLGGRDTEPDERQDHGPDSYMRLGAFADMSAPRAFEDGRTDVPLRTNAMQHCIELVASTISGNHVLCALPEGIPAPF
jgi:hypothetical protein